MDIEKLEENWTHCDPFIERNHKQLVIENTIIGMKNKTKQNKKQSNILTLPQGKLTHIIYSPT